MSTIELVYEICENCEISQTFEESRMKSSEGLHKNREFEKFTRIVFSDFRKTFTVLAEPFLRELSSLGTHL